MDVTEILRAMVAIPSVSSLSNRPVIDFALQFFDPAIWNIQFHPHEPSKVNLIATRGTGDPELALVCHTDTVPFDPHWDEALSGAVRDGKLYGRGSADVKGFLACILAAISQTRFDRLTRPLAVVLTADEEIGCVGAKFLAAKNALRARYMIVGEPTGLRPIREGKGYALAEIAVRGKEAHSAFPARGRSAIIDAAHIIGRLEAVAAKLAEHVNDAFDPPFTTFNIGLIRGGTAKNIVPGECSMTVEWRPIPGQDPEFAANLIRESLAGFDATLDVQRLDPPFAASRSNHLAVVLETLSGNPCATVSFGTEAPHMGSMSQEVVVFGPGDMTVAHKSAEFVPVAELEKCTANLVEAIRLFCA